MKLQDLPRVPLGFFPTPLEELAALAKRMGGPRLLAKRDDMTGLGLGGNKIRKLEFLFAEARALGANLVITTGGLQSNHTRLTSACARRLDMKCAVVLRGLRPPVYTGNLLLSAILDTEIHFLDRDAYFDLVQPTMDRICEKAQAEGLVPYQIPLGGATPLGAAGYVLCCEELARQSREQRVKVDYIVLGLGTGGTMAGLVAGAEALLPGTKVIGISVGPTAPAVAEKVAAIATDTRAMLGLPGAVAPGDLEIYDQYVGPAYAVPTEEGIEALGLVARTEGMFLDPVYTGKAMAGLLDLIRRGRFGKEETVVFLHTGGSPAVFAFSELLTPGGLAR